MKLKDVKLLGMALAALLLLAGNAQAAVQDWELINPKSIADVEPMKIIPHNFDTLNNKTVVLRWNGKNNGDNFLNRVAELLLEKFPQANIVKAWEQEPLTSWGTVQRTPLGADGVKQVSEMIKGMNPDIVITAQGD